MLDTWLDADRQSPAVELRAQGQRHRLPAVPGCDEGRSLVRQQPQTGGECGRVAARLDQDSRSASIRSVECTDASRSSGATAGTAKEHRGRAATPVARSPERGPPHASSSAAVSNPTTPRPRTTTCSPSTGPTSRDSCSAVSTRGSSVATRGWCQPARSPRRRGPRSGPGGDERRTRDRPRSGLPSPRSTRPTQLYP